MGRLDASGGAMLHNHVTNESYGSRRRSLEGPQLFWGYWKSRSVCAIFNLDS